MAVTIGPRLQKLKRFGTSAEGPIRPTTKSIGTTITLIRRTSFSFGTMAISIKTMVTRRGKMHPNWAKGHANRVKGHPDRAYSMPDWAYCHRCLKLLLYKPELASSQRLKILHSKETKIAI